MIVPKFADVCWREFHELFPCPFAQYLPTNPCLDYLWVHRIWKCSRYDPYLSNEQIYTLLTNVHMRGYFINMS